MSVRGQNVLMNQTEKHVRTRTRVERWRCDVQSLAGRLEKKVYEVPPEPPALASQSQGVRLPQTLPS